MMSILKTRLYKPAISKEYIVRRSLLRRLNDQIDRPFKLIVAGAGYGKSILISQWLDTYHGKYCWISLEEDCNDLQIFLMYLVAGIQQKLPGSLQHTAQLSSNSLIPADEVIAQTLNNELHDLPEPFIITLDDFHVIRNKSIINLINEIIKFPPENVKVVLISRLDPPLNKSRLQAYQHVTEIRMSDLRLSIIEIQELAKQSAHIDITTEIAKAIESQTEGWALSIHLKIKEIEKSNNPEPDNYTGYPQPNDLASNLFSLLETLLPPASVRLIMVVSLFNRFNIELIEHLFEDSREDGLNGKELDLAVLKLRQLDTPLLISLDDKRNWFRIHHLIRDILNKRLFQTISPDRIEKYYGDAGVYFADHNFVEEGIQYSILGKDLENAVAVILLNWEKLLDHGANLTLNRWINMLPADIVHSNPTLLIIKAYLCDPLADYVSMERYLKEASDQIDENTSSPRLSGSLASVHSAYCCYTNDLHGALNHASRALDLLLPDQGFLLDYAQNFKAFALNTLHSGEAAIKFISDNRSKLHSGEKIRLMRSHVIQMFIDWHRARIHDLKYSGQLVVEISENEKVWWFYKVGHYYLGQYYYIVNQIKEVYGFIDEGIACAFNSSPIWALHLYFAGALAGLADNDVLKARYYLRSANELIRLNNLSQFEGYIRAFEVEFALRTGNTQLAWKLNQEAVYTYHPPVYYYYIPQLSQIKLYIQQGHTELMKEAADMILQFKELVKSTNNLYGQIQIALLEAAFLYKSGKTEEAVSSLKELITMIVEPMYIRVFLDMGQPVKELLRALPEEEKQHPLVRNVLNAFRYESDIQHPDPNQEELTHKENSIMELVAQGMLNKEIADKLHLSESTIKTYLYRIYQKLGVKNRIAALQKVKQA